MYKVLIVDDELLLRTNLKMMIDWEKHGFHLIAEASNGEEALICIDKYKPDIILSDIRMPIMDGLQLSIELKEKYSNYQLIVFSNYDDFEYVKGTLKNGAVDYILKHNLNENVLLDALQRAGQQVSKNASTGTKTTLPIQTENTLNALREKFLIQLLTGVFKSEEEIQNHIDTLDIKIDIKSVLAAVMVVDDYEKATTNGDLKESALLKFSILNICGELLNDYGNGIIHNISNDRYIIIISFKNIHSTAHIENSIRQILTRISYCLKQYINIEVYFGIGNICNNIKNIESSYKNALDCLNSRFYNRNNSILEKSNISECTASTGISIDIERQIISDIKLNNIQELSNTLSDVFNRIKSQTLSLKGSQLIFGDLLSIVNRICREHDINLHNVYLSEDAPHILLSRLNSYEYIRDWIFSLYKRLCELLHSGKIQTQTDYVKRSLNIITSHYTENISLGYVADKIGISNTYLSTLFKEETGKGFSEYLAQLRLEKAMILLEENKHTIKEIISLCGFNDYVYFFKLFKKSTGMTPKEYNKKQKI